MTTNPTLEAALRWIDLGIAVIPIAYRTKTPDARVLRWTGHVSEKRASWIECQKTLTTEREIRIWTSGPRINLAVVTGWQGLVVLDFDTLAVWQLYENWLLSSEGAREVIELTYKVHTGRGVHVYLGVEEPVKNGHVGPSM